MATFAAHVVVHSDAGPVQFAPGDEVPDWAVDLVGDHVLADDPEPESASEPAAVDADDEDDPDADESDDEELDAPAAAPDFTTAAPRRGRPRK